jgi:hypothetical protein
LTLPRLGLCIAFTKVCSSASRTKTLATEPAASLLAGYAFG